jgi:hypothetical protein
MTDPKLTTDDIDNLGQAILTLTEELWIMKDRQKILEAALSDAGIIAPQALDRFEPDGELAESLRADRQQLVERVLSVLRKQADHD